jgi:hypothetical protein
LRIDNEKTEPIFRDPVFSLRRPAADRYLAAAEPPKLKRWFAPAFSACSSLLNVPTKKRPA